MFLMCKIYLIQLLEKLEKEKLEKQEKLGKMPVNDDGQGEGNCEEEPVKISDADIYIETRKRKENREYKLPEEVLKTVQEKIVSSNNPVYFFRTNSIVPCICVLSYRCFGFLTD